jgi:Protein of unknown function (DUF3093)
MNQKRIEPQYTEWVLPSWTSFLPVLAIFPTFWLTFLPIDEALGSLLGIVLTVAVVALKIAKAPRIAVTHDYLAVANAQIERRFITSVTAIGPDGVFAARGHDLDARAWIHFQGSVKSLVKVAIMDPNDPTPYWLFSTRNPEDLKEKLGF